MIYTDMTKRAMRIAYDAHKEQTDKSGLPYIYHPYHLAAQMTDEISACVALLHDVVEDSSMTFDDLTNQGISLAVIKTLKLLTHDSSVPYMDYIKRIKESGNQWAIAVKLADLRHNSDASRLDTVDEKAVARLRKYQEAIVILERQWCCESNKNIYIEKEHGTGLMFTLLRVNGITFCSSQNDAPMPRSYTDPIQTVDLINKKTFTTHRNPAYEHITIVPGLRLEYPVYDGDKQVAKMTMTYKEFFDTSCEYVIYDDDEIYTSGKCPYPRISISDDGAIEPTLLEWFPVNDVSVSIYPDNSFVYDSRSLVEERRAVSIGEQHLQWLPHIFHAYYLRFVV
jgi:hypothetical protein